MVAGSLIVSARQLPPLLPSIALVPLLFPSSTPLCASHCPLAFPRCRASFRPCAKQLRRNCWRKREQMELRANEEMSVRTVPSSSLATTIHQQQLQQQQEVRPTTTQARTHMCV